MPIVFLILLGGAGAAWYLKKQQAGQAPAAAPPKAPTAPKPPATAVGALAPPPCGHWTPIGPGVSGIPEVLRSLILAAMPGLSVHPQLPPSGSTFTAPAGTVLVTWYNAAGMVVPIAYCTATAPPRSPN
jgi:hypothetical protein